jgi:hypothetical protein
VLAKASLGNDESLARIAGDNLTRICRSVDPYVHEQMAQSTTWLAIEELGDKATKTWDSVMRW